MVYGELQRYAEAIEALKRAIQLKPGYAQAHFNLGMIYLHLNAKEAALQQLRELKALNGALALELIDAIHMSKVINVDRLRP